MIKKNLFILYQNMQATTNYLKENEQKTKQQNKMKKQQNNQK